MANPTPLSREFLEHVAEIFRVLGDPSRLEILQTLMSGPKNVTKVAKQTGKGQANVSKHLALLADAKLIRRTRLGTQVIYEVSEPLVNKLCDLVCGAIQKKLTRQVKSHVKLLKASR